jgi:hypothetical protein
VLASLIGMMFVSSFPAQHPSLLVGPLPAPRALPAQGECATRLREAVDRVREEGLDRADAIFEPLRAECEGSQGLARELAGIRFAQRRWKEAAALARTAVLEDPTDPYSFDLLGTTLLLQGEVIEALRAWNHIGKPIVSDVRITADGEIAVRVDVSDDAMTKRTGADLGVDSFAVLTPGRFQRARRRLDEIAAERNARVARFELRPNLDGTASLEARMVRQPLVPRDALNWATLGFADAIDREATIVFRSPVASGERCRATWRWWSNRPRLAGNCGLPRIALGLGYRGSWQIDTVWETDTYSLPLVSSPAMLRERWRHIGLRSSDWLTGSWHYSIGIGLDSWTATPDVRAFSLATAIERRSFDDRLSVALSFSQWVPVTESAPFRSVATRVAFRSSPALRAWQYVADVGVGSVSRQAPLSLWPGAAPQLRGHPALDRGIVSLNASSMLGKELVRGTVEARHWSDRSPIVLPIGLAGFLDFARASRQLFPDSRAWEADLGAGIRVRLPGAERLFRVDFGYGLRDGGRAVTFGSMF